MLRQGRRILMLNLFLCCGHVMAEPSPAAEPAPVVDAGNTADNPSALDVRIAEEVSSRKSHFALTPHKPNYLILSNVSGLSEQTEALQPWEMKFQVSVKVELVEELLGGNLLAAYTQQSYWQAFNNAISSPFRETNYEPEIMWQYVRPHTRGDYYNRMIVLGFTHQSNGRTQPFSRSWNRIYANLVFEYSDFFFSFKPWYRIPESAKTDPLSSSGDDNPDIEDYMGKFELTATWARHGNERLGLMLRNNLDFNSENRGAVQIDWSFPIHSKLLGYVQYFNGYGESLISYNDYVQRIGVGVMLNNWL